MTNIFIANLDWEITSEDLLTTFSTFGKVAYAHVVFDNATKKSRGFGYVEMESTDSAIAAIQALNGMEVNGRKLDVKIASPKSNRPPKKEVEEKKPAFKKKPFTKSVGQGQDRRNYKPGGNRSASGQGGERKPYNSNSDRQQQDRRPRRPSDSPYSSPKKED